MSSALVQQNSSDSTLILSPTQAQVAAALARGQTITAAAQQAGIHRTTVHHWLRNDPRFEAAVHSARREYAQTVNDDLLELTARALLTLRRLLDDPTTAPALQLKAALEILKRSSGWSRPEPADPTVEPEIAAAEPLPASVPRNAPCPCGSGIKYKRCCSAPRPSLVPSRPNKTADD
ncbi:MAG TPA: SEC-C metal-binding domain-containing protein [Bryobacteraceae bacterium]|jgi:transposase-like protein|nr:SEC-C metal-binding domain-containing protein [Bryobacteraceae bacterium]